MKILILSVSHKSGGYRAAGNIKKFMENSYDNCRVSIVDTVSYIKPALEKLISTGFISSLRSNNSLYSRQFDVSYDNSGSSSILYDLISSSLKCSIDEFCPDIIVFTHPFHLEILASLKLKGSLSIPVVALMTDFNIYSSFIRDFVDVYITPFEYMKYELIEMGALKERIFSLGIPASPLSPDESEKRIILNRLGLEYKKTVLLSCEGSCNLSISQIIKSLLSSDIDAQFIVITNNTGKLTNHIPKVDTKLVKIVDEAIKVQEALAISDIFITCALNSTTYEALAAGVPVAIVSSQTTQEDKHAAYITEGGAAVRLYRHNVAPYIKELLNSQSSLSYMHESALKLAKTNSVNTISQLIWSVIDQNKKSRLCHSERSQEF